MLSFKVDFHVVSRFLSSKADKVDAFCVYCNTFPVLLLHKLMDGFICLKIWILGIVWTGSFYFLAAYLLSIFPMPALFYFRRKLQGWSDNIAWLDEKKAKRRWTFSKFLFKILAAILWLSLMFTCLYGLYQVSTLWVALEDPYFGAYYAIAATLPSLFLSYWGIKIYRNAANSKLKAYQPDNRPALERLKAPLG